MQKRCRIIKGSLQNTYSLRSQSAKRHSFATKDVEQSEETKDVEQSEEKNEKDVISKCPGKLINEA